MWVVFPYLHISFTAILPLFNDLPSRQRMYPKLVAQIGDFVPPNPNKRYSQIFPLDICDAVHALNYFSSMFFFVSTVWLRYAGIGTCRTV